MIRHPGASAVVALADPRGHPDPRIVLIRQYRYAAEEYLLEVPAGRLGQDEDPKACASRELKEETGYTAGEISHLFTMYTTPGFTDEKIHVFLAESLAEGPSRLEPDEFLEVDLIPLSVAVTMVEKTTVVDAKTALSILFVSRLLEAGNACAVPCV